MVLYPLAVYTGMTEQSNNPNDKRKPAQAILAAVKEYNDRIDKNGKAKEDSTARQRFIETIGGQRMLEGEEEGERR